MNDPRDKRLPDFIVEVYITDENPDFCGMNGDAVRQAYIENVRTMSPQAAIAQALQDVYSADKEIAA